MSVWIPSSLKASRKTRSATRPVTSTVIASLSYRDRLMRYKSCLNSTMIESISSRERLRSCTRLLQTSRVTRSNIKTIRIEKVKKLRFTRSGKKKPLMIEKVISKSAFQTSRVTTIVALSTMINSPTHPSLTSESLKLMKSLTTHRAW